MYSLVDDILNVCLKGHVDLNQIGVNSCIELKLIGNYLETVADIAKD